MHLLRRIKFANSMYRYVLRRSKKGKSQKALIESAPTQSLPRVLAIVLREELV